MLTLNFTLSHTGHANYTEKTLLVTPSNDPPKIHILSPELSIVQGSIMSLSEWNGSCSIVASDVWDGPPRPLRGFISMRVSISCGAINLDSAFLSDFFLSANSLFTLRRSDQILSGNNSCQASNSQDPQALSTVATDIPLGFQSVYIDADIDTVKKLSAAIIYVAPSNYVGAVSILVNCSDHDNFGYDNNVWVHDQIELSVEKLQQDPLESSSSFPVEFVNEC
jgi:hypothetical protein